MQVGLHGNPEQPSDSPVSPQQLSDSSLAPQPEATPSHDSADNHARMSTMQNSSTQHLQSLWDWCSQQQGWSLSPTPLPNLGSFVLAAKVAPENLSGFGACRFSGNAAGLLGNNRPHLAVFKLNTAQSTAQAAGKAVVHMRMMLDENTGALPPHDSLP